MEVQLERVKQKRQERLAAERAARGLHTLEDKEVLKAERKKLRLKQEVDRMWLELEGTYGNNTIVKIEDDLAGQKLHLMELYQETKG